MKLCLNMIVKNESKILARCLTSLAPWIDAYAILDTGSTDGTFELVTALLPGLSGVVSRTDFVDFSQARNKALALVASASHDNPAIQACNYILLCDADMQLQVDDPTFKDRLTAPAYLVKQTNGFGYWNVRLLRRDQLGVARYVGATHEYLSTHNPERLEGVSFLDHADGASRPEKFERDERLLRAALEERDDPRSLYYLAQTLRDAGKHAEAAKFYTRRANYQNGWEEEAWHAQYRAAECNYAVGDVDAHVEAFAAYLRRPHRAEPLLLLARELRKQGKNDAAVAVALAGASLSYPEEDSLFVEEHCYGHGFDEEIAISGFYSKNSDVRAKARDACAHLTVCAASSSSTRDLARSNWRYYAEPLFVKEDVSFLLVPVSPGMIATNTSIAFDPVSKEMRAIVRTTNYPADKDERGAVRWPHATGNSIRTENFYARIASSVRGSGWKVQSSHPMRFESPHECCSGNVRGYEDCRLFFWRGEAWAVANVRDRTNGERCQMVLFDVLGHREKMLTGYGHKKEDGSFRHEKNWSPLVRDDELLLVYSYDPTVVLRVDPDTLEPTELTRSEPSIALDGVCGGAQLISWDRGGLASYDWWLSVVHFPLRDESEPMFNRLYLHRFVELDGELRVTRVSRPFYLVEKGIEYCAGLAWEGSDALALSFGGFAETRSCVASIESRRVERLLSEGESSGS